MIITVRFFARVRDLMGCDSLTLTIRPATTIADIRLRLHNEYQNIHAVLPLCTAAINHEVATDRTVIPDGAELAFLPPVSGGQP